MSRKTKRLIKLELRRRELYLKLLNMKNKRIIRVNETLEINKLESEIRDIYKEINELQQSKDQNKARSRSRNKSRGNFNMT